MRTKMEAKEPIAVPPKGHTNALTNPNLQLYLSGQVVSMVGTWMQQMALSWLVYRLTNSAYMLGVFGFVTQAPVFFLTPIGGMVADRVNRHKLVITTQTLAMIQAALLAFVVLSGHVQLWHLFLLSVFVGIVNAFDMPGRQTFLFDMLRSDEELPNAIAVNSSIVTATRIVGPAVAGICIAIMGEGMCFLMNAISYVAVIVALLFVKPRAAKEKVDHKHPFVELKEGISYAFNFGPIRSLIILLSLVGLFGMPYAVLMPAFAKTVFGGNAMTLGWLTGASGLGSLIGALYLATRRGVLGLGRWILYSTILFGAGLIAFGWSHNLILSMGILMVVGFGSMVQVAATNTILQTLVDADKRGRVMSLFTLSFIGLAPFGSMVAGWMANQVGTGPTVMASGVICLILAAGFGARFQQLRREIRPIYIERGILAAETEMKVLNS